MSRCLAAIASAVTRRRRFVAWLLPFDSALVLPSAELDWPVARFFAFTFDKLDTPSKPVKSAGKVQPPGNGVYWAALLKNSDCSENGGYLTVGFAGNAEMVGSFGKMQK
ncbi:MAG TPA: hypothetical protein DCY79_16035 [Planctomycetaceae bacterium]|nr:hypothetical protein [Planctomycetaceae bacterium]